MDNSDGRQDSEYLLTREAADLLRMKPQSMRRWRWAGGGPPYIKLGSKVLYQRSALLVWLTARTRNSTAKSSPSTGGSE